MVNSSYANLTGVISIVAHIVVIERDEHLAMQMTSALEAAGYRVEIVTDPAEGLRTFYQANPDLVILAEELPKVDGEDTCLRIRRASYLPIIVIGSKQKAVEALEHGVDAYINRPPDLDELIARVRALLRHKPSSNPQETNSKKESTDAGSSTT